MATQSELDEARVTERGVATFMAFGGAMLIYTIDEFSAAAPRYLLGGLLIAVGIGLWLQKRWARWLALGGCFLVLAGACLFPAAMLQKFPLEGYDEIRINALSAVFAFAFGAIGYKGLEYLRSASARVTYADGDDALERRLLGESSATVVWSAGAWTVLLGIAWFAGLDMPFLAESWRPAHSNASKPPPGFVPIDVYRDPSASLGDASLPEASHEFPDLLPLGLCSAGYAQSQILRLMYANVGKGTTTQRFHYTFRDARGDPPAWNGDDLEVRPPGEISMPWQDVFTVQPATREIFVDLDAGNRVQESDETNNSARFEIHRKADGSADVPPCNRSYLHFIAQAGPTRTAATIRPLPTLPDLAMLGLCSNGSASIEVRYANRGVNASGQFSIAQGADQSHLEVQDKGFFSMPRPGEIEGFRVGGIDELAGKHDDSFDVAVKLDFGDALLESDETNNVASAHVTRLAGSQIDLPDCAELERKAADPRWQNEDVILQPAVIPLPDLQTLGVCWNRNGFARYEIDFAYVNRGNVSNPGPVTIGFREDTREYTDSRKPSQIRPNELQVLRLSGPGNDGRMTLDVLLDSNHHVVELDEKNNSAHFEIQALADGRLNVPDCSTRQQLSDWL